MSDDRPRTDHAMPQEEFILISVAARHLGMHPQTLRKYERLGLVRPTRTLGSMRVYSHDELQRLRVIKHLVDEAGINLAGVQRLLAVADDQPIGFLLSEPLDDALFIVEIAVHQAWQGRGVGRMMLEQVIETARQAAYPAVTLTTFRDVPWNAPFYTRLGFSMLNELRLPAGLAAKRDLETEHGLAPETRCAMRLAL